MLSLPAIASSALGLGAYQLVELAFLSRLGDAAVAAVVITNQTIRQVILMCLMGSSFATQALIAQAIGAGDRDRAEHVAGQAIGIGIAFAALVALVGGAFPEPLFALTGADPSFFELGTPYVRLICLLNFGLAANMLFGSILGGAGDTTTPLFVQLLQAAVAIGAEWVLIFGNLGAPALGVRGVALGVACGQAASIAVGLWVLFRGRSRLHLRRRHLVPDPRLLREMLPLFWPPAVQMLGAVATTFAFVRLAGAFGEQVQAAYAIGLRLGMLIPMVCFPIATACATLVGQALGARDVERAWRAVGIGLAVHGAVMGSFAVALIALRVEILGLFSDDPEVIRIGSEYLIFAGGSFLCWAFYFPVLRSLQGAGDFRVPMGLSLANTLLFTIPLGYALAFHTSLAATGIWTAGLVGAATSTLSTGAWMATGRWTRRAAHSAVHP